MKGANIMIEKIKHDILQLLAVMDYDYESQQVTYLTVRGADLQRLANHL